MHTDKHRFLAPGSGLASLCFGLLPGGRILDMENSSFGQFSSVFIWVHLWLY